jgi:hypothetical protein
MAWTLGTHGPEDPDLTEEFFAALGRALYVASEFERRCAFILQIGTIVKRIEDNDSSPLGFKELIAPAIGGKTMLGPTVTGLRFLDKLREEELSLLDDGRRARNYIAHEAGGLGPLGGLEQKAVLKALRELEVHVEIISRADAMLSRWTHDIEEKEYEPPKWLTQRYSERLVEWVFTGSTDGLRADREDHDRALREQLARMERTVACCPACGDRTRLRHEPPALVKCDLGHVFELRAVAGNRTIVLTQSTDKSEANTEFPIPADGTFLRA